MQAQRIRTDQNQDVLTAQQSLQSIQTLLRAGLGCITYLRNLLPADNFSESYLTSASTETQESSGSFGGSFASDSSKRNVSGFKIMTVGRGYTEEADKLLDYLEKGIFDALQKQYLRSFVFAIYLDNDDPNNIVEAYTFNFQYYNIPGTDVTVPVMSLGDDLMKLSISRKQKTSDPVSAAAKKGKLPTLGEVKRSLKTLIKNLIQATTQMDALPRRRYATFKLFYHDHTPDDYEPPYFRAGDSKKDKWFFSTHDQTEVPEKCSIGQVQTGWHAVDLHVASVSAYLPSAEDNGAPFLGTTADGQDLSAPTLTPAEEAALRMHQSEAQRQDAAERRVVWDADEGLGDADADGEEDEEEGSSAAVWRVSKNGLEFVGPMGIRDDDGNITALAETDDQLKDPSPSAEAVFAGVEEKVPRHVGQLQLPVTHSGDLTQTQKIEQTQAAPSSPASGISASSSLSSAPPTTPRACEKMTRTESKVSDSLPPSDPIASVASSKHGEEEEDIDTQMLKRLIISRRQGSNEDAEMLDMETQVTPYCRAEDDSIQSFSLGQTQSQSESLAVSQVGAAAGEDNGDGGSINCECDVALEDCDCIMCDGCDRWYHIWCMGYHDTSEKSLRNKFSCFDCRVRADQNWDLIMVHGLHPRMMEKFRDLALFRRAIKSCEKFRPESLSAFTKIIGCEPLVAGQLFKRLENEGFIALEGRETDDLGLLETTTQPQKGKATTKQKNRRKTTPKQKYTFVRTTRRKKIYKDYFDPNSEAEKRLLGLSELNPKQKSGRKAASDQDMQMAPMDTSMEVVGEKDLRGDSQTQPETQLVPDSQEDESSLPDLKRKMTSLSDQEQRALKKVKISIGPAVDLGD